MWRSSPQIISYSFHAFRRERIIEERTGKSTSCGPWRIDPCPQMAPIWRFGYAEIDMEVCANGAKYADQGASAVIHE
jgi:hypothetical protein